MGGLSKRLCLKQKRTAASISINNITYQKYHIASKHVLLMKISSNGGSDIGKRWRKSSDGARIACARRTAGISGSGGGEGGKSEGGAW